MTEGQAEQPGKEKPKFFYGYVIVIASFFIMVFAWGFYTTFGLFFKPFQDDFGWSNASVSAAYSISMIVYGVMGFVVGALNDRFGPRIVMTACGVLLGLGFLLMSRVNSLWQIYLFYGIIIGVGMSGVWVPQLSSIARWFLKRRGLMTGIVLSGIGIGQLINPPIISRMIEAYDWRLTYIIIGFFLLFVIVAGSQFIKRDPVKNGCVPYGLEEQKQQNPVTVTREFTLKEAARTPQFYISFMILFCNGFGVTSFLVHIVRHAIELEISSLAAANILVVNGGVSILGSYVMGGIGDRMGVKHAFVFSNALVAIAMLSMVWANEIWMFFIIASILGIAMGSGAIESPLTAWLFGLEAHGLIYGIIHIGFTAGAALGPLLMGVIFDIKGSYQMAFVVGSIVGVVGIIISLILRPTRKTGPPVISLS